METVTVTAVYNNGKKETINKAGYYTDGYTMSPAFDSRTEGSKSITYTYKTKTAVYNYTVKALEAKEIKLSTTYGKYIVGDNMDNVTVTLVYTNGTSKTLNANEYSVTGFTTAISNVGTNKTATFTYNGLTATYKYDVRYKAEIGKVSVWFHADKYYLTFETPVGTTATSVTGYKADGSEYKVNINYSDGKYYISEANYNEIKKMKGTNDNQKLVVTFSNGVTCTYTVVIEK